MLTSHHQWHTMVFRNFTNCHKYPLWGYQLLHYTGNIRPIVSSAKGLISQSKLSTSQLKDDFISSPPNKHTPLKYFARCCKYINASLNECPYIHTGLIFTFISSHSNYCQGRKMLSVWLVNSLTIQTTKLYDTEQMIGCVRNDDLGSCSIYKPYRHSHS